MTHLMLLALTALGVVSLAVSVFTARLIVRLNQRSRMVEQQCLDMARVGGQIIGRLKRLDAANADLLLHVDRLAADVIHRELYRDKGNRQTRAMEAAFAGVSLETLVAEHGLSSDEAELLMSLHAGGVITGLATARS